MKLSELEHADAFEFYRTFLEWYCQWHHPNYLEIGCHTAGLTARLAKVCGITTGVDIQRYDDWAIYEKEYSNLRLLEMSSDRYFELVRVGGLNIPYGLIFIDGDHEYSQVMRDVHNSLMCLDTDGLIVLHDSNPRTDENRKPEKCGTVELAVMDLRLDRDLQVFTLPVKYGLTLVSPRR